MAAEAKAWHHEENLVEVEDPAYWRCQYHGMTTKNSSSSGVDQPELKIIQRAELVEPRRSCVDPRH